MNRKVREPFLIARGVNLALGIVGLVLFVLTLLKDDGTALYEILIFLLASVINAVGAIIHFSEGKKVRGNMGATICAVFFVIAVILAVTNL